MQNNHGVEDKQKLVLLVSNFTNPLKDYAAVTLGWMCKQAGVEFDAYYAIERDDGGIFSPHGSAVVGGRHVATIARALACYETTVVQLGKVFLMESLLRRGAQRVIYVQDSLADLYKQMGDFLGVPLGTAAVAFQSQNLPEGLMHGTMKPINAKEGHKLADASLQRQGGIVQYAYPEAVQRQALAVPLESAPAEVARLKALGVREVWTVATQDADQSRWIDSGFTMKSAEVLAPADDLLSFTSRTTRRWISAGTAVDLTEPLLASHLLPFAIREGRLQMYGADMSATATAITPFASATGQQAVYGRYAGGSFRGAVTDEDLFDLFRAGIPFQVTEPGRPVLTIFGSHPEPLPQPEQTCFDLEPSDAQLATWAAEKRILVTMVTHSGELSHNDAVINMVDLTATTGVKAGVGVQYQRYAFDPEGIELLQVPVCEGGVLGLVEPVLHSGGFGIIAEALTEPKRVADLLARARAEIARLAGERFAPRGVYLYCDTTPPEWERSNEPLWEAICQAGFEYVVSSVGIGYPRILYRQGDFVVLNQCGRLHYPYSPFARVDTYADLAEMETQILAKGGPGWILPVLDIPIYGYSNYLSMGDPFKQRGGLGPFYEYIRRGGNSGRLISVTPRTIARYARLIEQTQ